MQAMRLTFLILSAMPAMAQPPRHGFCVENGSHSTALFVVDAGAAYRSSQTLPPNARLCTPEFAKPTNGFVSVFYDETAIEGCSRLTRAGAVQVLLKYADFDNCTWQISP
jgi:hypothetical protein